MKDLFKEFKKGLWKENAVFVMLLGMCPVLAVTNSASNGLAMGLATGFVLISSAVFVSTLRHIIPHQVRIASYIVIIATFVTIADYFLAALFPPISKALGPYVPLIVVNCLILGRAEAFSSKHSIVSSVSDALGMGLGFTGALVILGSIREILGNGSIFEFKLFGDWFEPWIVMLLPGGAFLTLGLLIGAINCFTKKRFEMGVKIEEDIGYIKKGKFVTTDDAYQQHQLKNSPLVTEDGGQITVDSKKKTISN